MKSAIALLAVALAGAGLASGTIHAPVAKVAGGRPDARSAGRAEVLDKLRRTAESPNYYWAWTHPWVVEVWNTKGDRKHVVEANGRFRPKPTDEVTLESEYQKYSGGLRTLVSYGDLATVTGTWHSDVYYQVNRAALTAAIRRQWKELGCIQVFSWHMDQPYCTNGFRQASYRFKSGGEDRNVIRQILDGTGGPCGTDTVSVRGARKPFANPREWFLASLKDVADFFNGLVDEETGRKIPVILRYPHECDGSWFWWGNTWCTPEEFRRFCRFEADYLRKACGAGQIIFAYTPDRVWKEFGREGDSDNTYLAWYPGDELVDLVGLDDYSIGNGGDASVEASLGETVRRLRQMTAFARQRGKVACLSESGGRKKRDDFWQYLHRAATAEGVEVAFVNTWSGACGTLPATPASAEDEKAFAARPQVLMETKDGGFRAARAGDATPATAHDKTPRNPFE